MQQSHPMGRIHLSCLGPYRKSLSPLSCKRLIQRQPKSRHVRCMEAPVHWLVVLLADMTIVGTGGIDVVFVDLEIGNRRLDVHGGKA